MKKMAAYLLLSAIFLAGCGTGAGSASGEPPPIVETGIDPDAWVRIPAGEFLLGLHEHETLVDYDYETMVTDVTNAQYARYLNEALAAGSIEIVDDQVMG